MKVIHKFNDHSNYSVGDYPKEVSFCAAQNHVHFDAKPYSAEIEYLESTGTQYIDLNYFACGKDIVELRVRSTTNNWTWYGSGSNATNYPLWNPFFGMQVSGTYKFWGTYVRSKNNNDYLIYFYNQSAGSAAYPSFKPALSSTTVMNWYTYKFNQRTVQRDGVSLTGSNGGTINNTVMNQKTIYLFTANEDDTQNSTHTGTSKIQLAWFKLSDSSNNLVFDMIPVRVGTVGYMYDKVSGKLFGNAGTGDFVLGADK